jgi:adenylate cyclase
MTDQNFQEIERKFLIVSLPPNYQDFSSVMIIQHYLSTPGIPPVLRVRKYGEDLLLTVKKRSPENPMICGEVEIALSPEEYNALKKMGEEREITKRRYFLPWETYTIELDIFEGKLAGLILAEIEFPSEDEALRIALPPWFGREVTEDSDYSNNHLSLKGIPDKYKEEAVLTDYS